MRLVILTVKYITIRSFTPFIVNSALSYCRPVVVLKNIADDPEEKENRKFMPPPAGIPRAKTRALTRTVRFIILND